MLRTMLRLATQPTQLEVPIAGHLAAGKRRMPVAKLYEDGLHRQPPLREEAVDDTNPVSYTHLTLPTIRLV